MVGTAVALLTPALLLAALSVPLVGGERLAKPGSTHPSFPIDAFAKPTFKLTFDEQNPISNQTALDMLQGSKAGASEAAAAAASSSGSSASSTGVGAYSADGQGAEGGSQWHSYEAYLHRTSPSSLHLCSVPHPRQEGGSKLHLNESGLAEHRREIVKNALKLLSPLKETCLFHTLEWFTYSLCYGDAIKQFRALPGTAGGGLTPAVDPTQDSYVLGRWNEGIEAVKGIEQPKTGGQLQSGKDEAKGTELMELIHFSSLEGTDSDRGRYEEDRQLRSQTTVEGKGRYISQVWTDGTRCIINNELRTAEVQFHCSKSPAIDRISLIKEVTTCNYIVVVDTPRLCEEPALDQVEDEVREVRCQPILSDEELRERASSEKASVGGIGTGSISTETKEATVVEDKDVQKIGREEVRASLASIVSRLNTAAGEVATDVEIVVGWDEEGKFIIEPRSQGAELDVEKLLDESASRGEKQEAEPGAKAKDKWELLLEKLLDLEDQIFDAADAHDSQQTRASNDGEQNHGQQAPKAKEEDTGGRPGGEATMTKGDGPPSRTNQMIRETENFAQRVERFYKAQEVQRQKSREDEEKEKAKDARVGRERDEL